MESTNNLPDQTVTHRNKKPFIITSAIAFVVLVGGITTYGLYAADNNMWPFSQHDTSVDQNERNNENGKKLVEMTVSQPEVHDNGVAKVVSIPVNVKTNEQGDCKLIITRDSFSRTLTSTTKGFENENGCLDWNIGTDEMSAGSYNVKVLFYSVSGATSEATTTLVLQ